MGDNDKLFSYLSSKVKPTNKPQKNNINPLTGKPMTTEGLPYFIDLAEPITYPKFNEQIRLLGYSSLTESPEGLEKKFAHAQSNWEQAGRAVKGFTKQAVGGFLMSAGATIDFDLGINTIAGIEDEYDNWFLRTGAKLIEETETDPEYQIYEEKPGKLNFGDGAWWFNQFKRTGLSSGIALEAAFETAIISALTGGTGTGATIAKSGGNVNKLVNFLKASNRTTQMRRNAMVWAGIRRHGESVIESYYNFHETENELKIKKERGEVDLSDEQIKKIAANRAADTYRANIPLVIFDLITANALTINPITGGAVSSGIIDKTINSIKRPLLRKMATFGVTGMSEGLEEFFQYGISEETGYSANVEAGVIKDKDKKDFGERLGEYVVSDEGWNNFFAGVFGAAVMGGGAKVIHKLGDVVNGKPYASEQKEFVNNMINTGRTIQEQIRLEEESGNSTGTDNLRRTLGIHKAITGLELDRLTGKTNSFESYTSYLQDMLETLNSDKIEQINELGISDIEKNKQMYSQYLEDAKKIKQIYSDVAQTNMPNAISKITAAKFSTEVLTDAQNKINTQINEIKTRDNSYKELTPKGQQILDIALSIDALNKNKQLLEKKKSEEKNPFVKFRLTEEIAAINNGIKAHTKDYNDILKEDDTRTENEKDSDVNKIKILRATNLASLYTELEAVTSKKRQDEKSLVKWMDQKYQAKDFLGITNKKLNKISSIEEVNALKKGKAYDFMTKKQIQKLNDIEKKFKAKETVNKVENKPPVSKAPVTRTATITKEEQAQIEEQKNIQAKADAKPSKMEDVLDDYIASSMPSKSDVFGVEEELTPGDFDENEFYQEPASIDNVSEEQKTAFKTLAKRLHDAYKEDHNENPSFKGVISKLLQVRSKSDVKPYFDSIYIGWKENNYKLGDDEYYKAYQLFSDFGEIFDEFKAFDNLTPQQKSVEKTGDIQQTQQTKKEPAKQVPIESGDKPIKIKLRTTDSNHQAYFLSQEVVKILNDDGTFEMKTKNPGELYEAPDIDHKRLLDPNFKEGDICTLGIPTNEDFEITTWNEEGNKTGTITLRELKNTYKEGSDEYIDMMPILVYDKEGIPVFMAHTPDWFNKNNVGLENNTKKQIELINQNIENNRQLRKQLYDSADNNLDRQVSVIITEKELGFLDKVEGDAPISQMAPNALIGRAESAESLIVYDDNGEAFSIHIKDPNVTFTTGKKAIARRSQDSFVEGYIYDVRLALIKKDNETGEEVKHYVILNANPTTLTKEKQATVLRMLKAFLNDESTNEKLKSEALKTIASYKQTTNFNLSVNSEFIAAMKEFVNIKEIDWEKGDASYYVKSVPEGKPFIFVGHSKKGPTIYFGIKGQKPYEKAKDDYLFVSKETFQEGKANAALSYFAKTIIPNMYQNASFPSLKRGTKTYDILVNGDVVESKTSKGTNNYFDHIKDSFTNNVKSHNVGTEENPIWSPIVQPRIRFAVLAEGEEVKPVERKTKTSVKPVETITTETVVEDSSVTELIDAAINAIGKIGGKANQLSSLLKAEEGLSFEEPALIEDSQVVEALKGFTANIDKLTPIEEDILTEYLMQNIISKIDEDNYKVDKITEELKSEFDKIISEGENEITLIYDKLSALYETDTVKYNKLKQVLSELQNGIQKYDNIKNNWDVLKSLTLDKIQKTTSFEINEDEEDSNPLYDNFDYGKNSFEVNHKTSVSKRLKTFFSGIELTDGEGNVKRGFMNVPLYSKLDDTWDTVEQIISSEEPDSSYEDMVKQLEEFTYAYPWLDNFITKLENAPGHIKNEFVYEMTKHVLSMKFIMFSKDKGKDSYTTRVFNTNSADLNRSIIASWWDNAKHPDNGLIDYVNGEFIVSQEKANSLLEQFKSWSDEKPPKYINENDVKENKEELESLVKKEKDSVTLVFSNPKVNNKLAGRENHIVIIGKNRFLFEPVGKNTYRISTIKKSEVPNSEIIDWLSHFGINVSNDTINEIKDKGLQIGKRKYTLNDLFLIPESTKSTNLFGILVNYLKNAVSSEEPLKFDEEGNDNAHPLKDLDTSKVLRELAKMESKYTKYNVTKSFRDNKKSIYGFTATKFSTDRIKKLKKDTTFLNTMRGLSFHKHSMLLELMANDDEIRNKIQIDHLGLTAIKNRSSKAYKDTKINKLSPYDLRAAKAGFFFDTKQGSLKERRFNLPMRIVRIMVPLAPDKTGATMLNMPVFNLYESDIMQDGQLLFSDAVKDAIYSQLVLPELERILSTASRKKASGIKNYDEGAKIFTMFPMLNTMTHEGSTVLDLIHNGDMSLTGFEKVFKTQATNIVVENLMKQSMDKARLFTETFVRPNKRGTPIIKILDKDYFEKGRGEGRSIDVKLLIAATDMTINTAITNANMFMSIIGDPAYFQNLKDFKANFETVDGTIDVTKPLSENSYLNVVEKLNENMGKRLAMLIAPRKILANSKGQIYRQLMINDALDVSENMLFLISENYPEADLEKAKILLSQLYDSKEESVRKAKREELEKMFPDIADYLNIESTDAQEYVTVKEAAYVKYKKGQMTEDDYNSIIKKSKAQREFEKKYPNREIPENLLLTNNEKKLILGPEKPVYTGQIVDNTNDTMRTVYIKSSAVPLIPEFTIGRSIDKLRIALEQYEEEHNTYLRASYQTANKVGANVQALSIFNTDGSIMNIDQNALNNYIVTLNREDFGIQQEVPYKEDKDTISIGTQTVKLLFGDGVMNMKDFKYNGKPISGKDLYIKYNELFEDLIQENKKQLYSELGIDMNTNMPMNVKTSMKKVNKLLVKEAKNRNFPKQDIESLELIEIVNQTGGVDEMTFKLPLWSAANSNRYESMLLSIIRKRLINISLPGASFATMSETGFNYIENINDIEKKYQNKIIHTSSWNGKELQASVNDNGSYHAQIMMPSKFRDNEGNLIDLFKKIGNTYMYIEKSKNGWKLKEGMIQKELLNLFSFRIPTSSHVSMSSVEIVGFLPEKLGDVILLPKNFTKKMGLDFDIDKQYHYNLWTQMNADGSIIELPEGIDAKKTLENNIVKIHNAVLSHPSVQKIHNKVLSTNDAKKQSNIINDKINSTIDKSNFTFLSDEYQSEKVLAGASGGLAIGIYSNYVTLHSLIQQANVMGNNIHMYEVIEKQPVPLNISIAGRTNNGGTLGNQKTIDEQRSISEVLGELQNTALDNLKLLILGKTNINDITINAATILVLLGFDKTNDVVTLDNNTKEQLSIPYLFTSQPVIREYVKQMKNSKAVFEDFNTNREGDIIFNLEKTFGFSLGESDNRILSDTSGQNLYDNLTSPNPETQREVLALFLSLSQYGNTLTSFQSLFNINKSGAGKSMFEAIDKFERLKDINSNFGFRNLGFLIGEFAKVNKDNSEEELKEKGFVQVDDVFIKPTTVTGHMIVEGLTVSYNLWTKYFPYNTKIFRQLYLSSLQGIDTEELSSKKTTELREELFRDLKRYWNSNAIGTFTGDPNVERKRLFLEENGLSLASYTVRLKNTRNNDVINESIKGNALINSITPVIRKKGNLSTMEFNNTGNDAIQDEYKYLALLDLISKKDRLPDFNYEESIFYEEIDITEKNLSKDILDNIENDIQDGLFVSERLSEEEISKFRYKDKSYKLIYKGYLNAEEINKETSLSTSTINSTDTERKHVYEVQPFYTTRDYARDIISYAYLEGGIQEAIQFVKYVPVSVLESLGYSDVMRLNHKVLSSDNLSSFNAARFLRQRFQHNPNLAIKLNEIQVDAITEQQKTKSITQTDSFYINESIPFEGVKFVSVYNPSSIGPTYLLFENDGTGVFYKIPVLGEFGMSEYNSFADVNKTILSITTEEQIETPKKIKSSLETILDKIESPTLKNVLKKYDTVEGYLDVLVDYIGEDTKIQIDNTINSQGLYHDGIVSINTKESQNLTRTLIHELSHAATVKYLGQYFTIDPITKENILRMPVENMPEHAKNFYRIFNEARNKTMTHPKYEEAYVTMKQKIKNKEGLKGKERVVYGVHNIFEFVPAIIENKSFIEDIGSLEYKETGKTIRERFREAFENFMILIGAKDNTILKSALNSLFSFLETEKEISEAKEGLTSADKRAADYLNSLNTIPDEDIFGKKDNSTNTDIFGESNPDITNIDPTEYEEPLVISNEINPKTGNKVDFNINAVTLLQSDKAKQIFDKGTKNNWTLDKVLNEIGGFADSKTLFNQGDLKKNVKELNREQLASNIFNNYNFDVKINTTIKKERDGEDWLSGYNFFKENEKYYREDLHTLDAIEITKEEYDTEVSKLMYTSYYSNLTVPGGTNYTENEISIPKIIPSIKGHAQFATDKGIGWFRSDEQVTKGKVYQQEEDDYGPSILETYDGEPTKTRRVLEVQSDLFQKGRDLDDLITNNPSVKTVLEFEENEDPAKVIKGFKYNEITYRYDGWYGNYEKSDTTGGNWVEITKDEYISTFEKKFPNSTKNLPNNQFLQLLNKDNNWVTFFIKSIIQDSAKKGYEKVLFPKGETAAKIEGHETIADELIILNKRIEDIGLILEGKKDNEPDDMEINPDTGNYTPSSYPSNKELINERNKLEQRKSELKSQGIEKLKPIEAFYEIKVGNILKKNYKVTEITDEYGNNWNEIKLPTIQTKKYLVDLSDIKACK